MYSNLHLSLSYISWKMEKPQIYMEMYAVSFLPFSFYILQMFIFFGLINPDYVIVNGDEKKITFFQFILDSVSCIGQCNLFMHLVFSQNYTILCVKYYESIKNFYLFKCKKWHFLNTVQISRFLGSLHCIINFKNISLRVCDNIVYKL